jgi:hypothetical protein
MAPIKNRQQKPVSEVAQSLSTYPLTGWHTFINGAPLTPPTYIKTMETVTITNNGATIQMTGDYTQIANFLIDMSKVTVQPAPVANNEPEQLLPFNELVLAELTNHLGDKIAKKVVNLLEYCREGYVDFSPFVAAYRWVGNDIEKRQLLKTVSAIYRYKFAPRDYTNSYQYSLKSEIKYATICPHCGKIANALVESMKKEGLWK